MSTSKIISIANQKGGVGKTTTAHNLGVCLSRKGKKVLLIDLDIQASLTISAGLEPIEHTKNITSLLQKNGIPAVDCIEELTPTLHMITSIVDLALMEIEMFSRASREKILERSLEPLKDFYDYILIDCPPQLSILTVNALSCSNAVLIPVKTDYLAYRGIEQLMDTITEVQDIINPDLKVLGVIATLFEMRNNDDKEILEELKNNYNVMGVVKKLVSAKKGIYEGLSSCEYAPSGEISISYHRIADSIINTLERKCV